MATKYVTSLAAEEAKLERKKTNAAKMLKELKEGGLLGDDFEVSGYDLSTGVPKIGKKPAYKPKTREDQLKFAKDKHAAIYGDDEGEEYQGPATLKAAKTPPTKWGEAGLRSRLAAVFTPGPTAEEKRLGPLRPGGIFKPPTTVNPMAPAQAPVAAPAQAPAAQQAEIEFPPEVTTTSAAVDFLMKSQGMDKPQAIQYLRQINAQ